MLDVEIERAVVTELDAWRPVADHESIDGVGHEVVRQFVLVHGERPEGAHWRELVRLEVQGVLLPTARISTSNEVYRLLREVSEHAVLGVARCGQRRRFVAPEGQVVAPAVLALATVQKVDAGQ